MKANFLLKLFFIIRIKTFQTILKIAEISDFISCVVGPNVDKNAQIILRNIIIKNYV